MGLILRFVILNLLRLQDAWTAYDRRTETKEERERKRTTKRYTINSSNVVEKVLHKFFSWTLNRLLFLRMSYFKWMHICKKWFSRFFLCSGMKLEFLFSTGINNNHLYSFWTEITDLLAGLFGYKMRAINRFFHSVCQIVFRCALTVTRKFCPYVRNM